MMIFSLERTIKIEFPNAKCEWCGDTGHFEDDEGNEWICFEDCPRDRDKQ